MSAELVDTTTGEIVDGLTSVERGDLTAAECVIERGLATFVEVGESLARIRDARLYREGYATFDAYCRDRWNLSQRHVNRLVEASETVRAMGPNGPAITNEAQALDANDVSRIVEERIANREKVVRSTDLMVEHVGPWLTDLLEAHGSIDAAVRAGAVTTADSDAASGAA
jgi:hypothetical protein